MIKSQLARKIAANLGTTDSMQAPTAAQVSAIDHNKDSAAGVSNVVLNGSLVNNGGVNNGEQASNSSEEEVQNALIRSASPSKTREASAAPAEEDTAADHMRKLLGDIVTHSRAAIKAGDDKVALAVTAYSWVCSPSASYFSLACLLIYSVWTSGRPAHSSP